MNKVNKGLLVEQPRLGRGGMIAIITVSNMVASLSTDMYLPALPSMADYFDTTARVMNLTLIGFFFFFAIGMLIFGPISDKVGRKRILLGGIAVYALASLCCAFSVSVWMLIAARILQALGGGCMVAVTTAIVKDQFSGSAQGSVLAVAQVLSVLSPVLAPIVGAQVFKYLGWRANFIILSAIGCTLFIMCSLMNETLMPEKRLQDRLIMSFTRLGVVMKNTTFSTFLLAMITFQIPMMAYITTSSYIYVKAFGLTTTEYSFYFAVTALLSVLGPVMYVFFRNREAFSISFVMFGVTLACGAAIILGGQTSPVFFAAAFAPAMMMGAGSRPFSTTILLNQSSEDAGSASSLINFANSMAGTIGMTIITLIWNNYILGVGILLVMFALIGGSICLFMLKHDGRDSLNEKY